MIDPVYQLKFMEIFNQCMRENFTTVDARNYAELTLRGKLFHEEQSNNKTNE